MGESDRGRFNTNASGKPNGRPSDAPLFIPAGTDGGLLPAPVRLHYLILSRSQRFDLVVDFSERKGANLAITNDAPTPYARRGEIAPSDVVLFQSHETDLPIGYQLGSETLLPFTRLDAADAVRERSIPSSLRHRYSAWFEDACRVSSFCTVGGSPLSPGHGPAGVAGRMPADISKGYYRGKDKLAGKDMRMVHSTVTSKGQTTIPEKIRKALRIKPGDKLEYEVEGDRATIRVHPGIRSLKGALASNKGKGRSFAEIREAAARAARHEGIR
jgi:AbrB family looped-hinge helix DNA binding protein